MRLYRQYFGPREEARFWRRLLVILAAAATLEAIVADEPPAQTAAAQTAAEQTAAEQTAAEQTAAEQTAAEQTAAEQTAHPGETNQVLLWIMLGTAGVALVGGAWAYLHWRSGGEGEDEMGMSESCGGEMAFRDFLDLFFSPMVEDGRLASHEFAPLSAAYFALGVEDGFNPDQRSTESSRESIRLRMQEKVKSLFQPGAAAVPGLNDPCRAEMARRLVDAWKRITSSNRIQRLTLSDRTALLDWIDNTLRLWNQPIAHDAFRAHAAAQTLEYLSNHCGARAPTDGDRMRVRLSFTAAEKLLASLYNPDDTQSVSSAGPAQTATENRALGVTVADSLPEPACCEGDELRLPSATAASPSVASPTLEVISNDPEAARLPTAASEPGPSEVGSVIPESPPEAASSDSAIPPRRPKVVQIDLTDRLRHLGTAASEHVAARRRQLCEQATSIVDRIDHLFGDFSKPTESPLALSPYRSLGTGHIAVVVDEPGLFPVPFWFLGDIHGDLLGLDAAIEHIDSTCPNATIIFLGDLFDDEGFGLEVLLRVFQLIVERPGRIGYVVGNHDVSLKYMPGNPPTFSSSVSPCDFAEFLNEHRMDPVMCALGQRAVEFFAAAPRAIFLPDGLIVAHGGIPLVSRLPDLKVPADLERPECLQDFVWTRAHERARKKIPNPTSKTSEFGFEDFALFCAHTSQKLGIPATRMVRGHDHFEAGHSTYERWLQNQCVTVNTLSRRLPRDPFGTFHRTPCIARWLPGEPLEIHQLIIPAAIVEGFYGKPSGTEAQDAAG